MNPLIAVAAVLALVLLGGALGVGIRHRDGRMRGARGQHADDLVPTRHRGELATLVQFSTPLCARCPGTARLLAGLAAERAGVSHLEIDLEARPELATRFGVLQTPTVLLLDREQRIRARIGGVPRVQELRAALAALDAAPGLASPRGQWTEAPGVGI